MQPVQRHDANPTAGEMVGEVAGLTTGLGILLLPLSVITLPGLILFFIAPAVLLALVAAVPVAIVAAIAAPPYLLVRAVRRRRRRQASAVSGWGTMRMYGRGDSQPSG